MIIIDHNTLWSFTNIKRTLKTNIYVKHCNLDILIYNIHLTQVGILEDDIYIGITIIANAVVITEQKIELDNFIRRIGFMENPYIQSGQFITKMTDIYKEHFAHILCHFANIRTAKICHYIFLVIVINNIYFRNSFIKSLLIYIVYIEQHYHNIVIYINTIIPVTVNYNLSLDISLSLDIMYYANIIVNIIIYLILSSSIKKIDYLDHLQYNIIKLITGSSNLKKTTYLDYVQYIIIYIIISNNNINEIDYSDYIQLYIIIVIYLNSVTNPNYLYNIKDIIIVIISSSNIINITLLFNIIDYIVNSLLIIIKNMTQTVCYIKTINIIHINYKHHIDIGNIKTINIITYNNINKTVNKIYLYIINIINSHTIIDAIHFQYNITLHIFSVIIIMTVELYQPISYTLTNLYGFIISIETGHPIGDVNLILYINTKKTSYVNKPALHHTDRHHCYIQNIDDIKGMHHCILEGCIGSIEATS